MKCSKNCVGGTVGEASESGSLIRVIGVSNGKRLFQIFISLRLSSRNILYLSLLWARQFKLCAFMRPRLISKTVLLYCNTAAWRIGDYHGLLTSSIQVHHSYLFFMCISRAWKIFMMTLLHLKCWYMRYAWNTIWQIMMSACMFITM